MLLLRCDVMRCRCRCVGALFLTQLTVHAFVFRVFSNVCVVYLPIVFTF